MSHHSPSQGLWSRMRIATLSNILLVLMAMAGLFFTAAFGYLNYLINHARDLWNPVQSAVMNSESASTLTSIGNQAADVTATLNSLHIMTLVFIGAVLIAVGIFFILMYATLRFKIVKPIQQMEQGIRNITASNDFSKTLDVSYADEVGQVLTSFNDLTQNLKAIFDGINHSLSKVADGQFDQRCTLDVHGDLSVLQDRVNASVESVSRTMNSLEKVADAIAEGNFSVRMDPGISGGLKTKVDNAMKTMETIVLQINAVMNEVAKNTFDQRVTVEALGQLQDLKNYINQAVHNLSNGLQDINTSVKYLSEGRLDYQISSEMQGEMDRLKTHLNQAIQTFDSSMGLVIRSVKDVSLNASQIAQGNDDLSDRTQTQAASLEQTASAMEEMTASVRQASESAENAQSQTQSALNMTDKGRTVMNESVQSMEAIQQSSEQINDIVALIDSIAFQTNLLALNAAVEAARAGEHGRGFAVVASEVRNLAGKSSEAAKQIRNLIEKVVEDVRHGASQLSETQQAFEEIHFGIQSVNGIVMDLAAGAKQQSQGIEQVNQAIGQLDNAVQQNAALVEQTSASANELSQLSMNLEKAVSFFQVQTESSSPLRLEDNRD